MIIFYYINLFLLSFVNPVFSVLFDTRIGSLFGGVSLFSILFAFMLITIVLPILLHSSFSNFKGMSGRSNSNNNKQGDSKK